MEPVLDSLRYQTAYAFDVLTYLIVDRLASSGREKLKPDGLNISDWLQVRAGGAAAPRRLQRTAALACLQVVEAHRRRSFWPPAYVAV